MAAPTMRKGSRPGWLKKRRSSMASTALIEAVGQLLVAHEPALVPLLEEVRDELRLQGVRREEPLAAHAAQLLHAVLVEDDRDRLVAGAGHEDDRARIRP
jgi:hypothetical protein